MGDNSEPQKKILSETTNLWRDGAPPSRRRSSEEPRVLPNELPLHSADVSAEKFAASSMPYEVPLEDTSCPPPVPAEDTASEAALCPSESTTKGTNRAPWRYDDTVEPGESSTTQGRGKGRKVTFVEPVARFADEQPDQSDGLLRPILTNASGRWTGPLPPPKPDTVGKKNDKPHCGIKYHPEGYPAIEGPRTFKRKTRPRFRKGCAIPEPRNMYNHHSITIYAGERLFRLGTSVPYLLGPLALMQRVQLIIETPLLLPRKLREFIASSGIDTGSLTPYDLALFLILGILWDD